MMWHWYNLGFGGFWWLMPIIMLVFWGLIIWGIVVVVRGVSRRAWSNSTQPASALDILKRRYASGEITKQEFEEKKQAIG